MLQCTPPPTRTGERRRANEPPLPPSSAVSRALPVGGRARDTAEDAWGDGAPVRLGGLPAGFRVEFDPTVRRPGPDRLVGGVPTRMLRLSGRGVEALAELDAGPIRSAAAGVLARRLAD